MNIKYYVVYDNDFNVVKITTEVNDDDNFFEIDREEAAGFSIGTKSLHSYIVRRSQLDGFFLEEKQFGDIEYLPNDILEVKKTKEDVDLYVIHNLKDLSWNFKLADKVKKLINADQLQKNLKFYITSESNSNFLIRTLEFTLESLVNDTVLISFVTEDEKKIKNISIFTKRYFNLIGIADVKN